MSFSCLRQLRFFRKGLKSLETIEPHVKLVTEQQHIDYPFNGLEDDAADDSENDDDDSDDSDEGNVDNGYEAHDDGELSFDYRLSDQGQDGSVSRESMEVRPLILSATELERFTLHLLRHLKVNVIILK